MLVEPRTTKFVAIEFTIWASPLIAGSAAANNVSNATVAISSLEICTVVSCGIMYFANGMSSNPTTDKSPGISR